MTNKLNAMPQDQFVALWNAAESFDEAVAKIQALVGRPCPRWAVMVRSAVCRQDGIPMKRFEETPVKAAG